MSTPHLPWQLVDDRIAADPARVLFTCYTDGDRGEDRTDLTGATWATWVAKTANLLVDDLGLDIDADPPPTVAVDLPPHWQTAVWADAVNRVGARLATGPDAFTDGPEVAVALPADAAAALAGSPGDVLVAPLRPMNAPHDGPLPQGVLDYSAEVSAHGDRFTAPVREFREDDEALLAQASALVDSARLAPGARLLSTGTLPGSPYVELLAVCRVGGSLVLCPGARDLPAAEAAARWAAERVTAAVPADADLLG